MFLSGDGWPGPDFAAKVGAREDGVDDRQLEDLAAVAPAVLDALERLGFVARYLNPPDLPQVLEAVGAPQAGLRAALGRLDDWPESLGGLSGPLQAAGEAAILAFDDLHAFAGDLRQAYRALRHVTRAQEALYPLASVLAPVNRFFLEPALRDDEDLQRRLAGPRREDTGLAHIGDPGARGGFSMYVPETYTPETAWPLVVALHGGSGNGRAFLWSWLRDVRGHGAILIAPTAVGDTWALTGPDLDTPNLRGLVERVRAGWNIDPNR
ncbi:hypothetical protein, partial [Phenylobacterium sp.]|uniref:hypothetical protein n=1 Tax=Phenylobacterium sp. TaxID=1871053 RepID=UPI00286B75C5